MSDYIDKELTRQVEDKTLGPVDLIISVGILPLNIRRIEGINRTQTIIPGQSRVKEGFY